MPGVALHFVLARRVLERWKEQGSAPFDPASEREVNAFYHGAVGPDLGYFPGGERLLSELSHCVRTGVLTRTLVTTARTPTERAFAWGWVSHVVADREIHPLIGRAVGALTTGSAEVFVDGASDLLSHLRVELGLDCWYAARQPQARRIRLAPLFDRDTVAFLGRAYERTYGARWSADVFLRSHDAVVRRSAQLLASLGFVKGLMDEGSGRRDATPFGRLLRAAWKRPPLRCAALAYLNPVAPSDWLVEQVGVVAPRVIDGFEALYASGLESLSDDNLDTGRPVAVERGHAGTVRARKGLDAMIARQAVYGGAA